MILMSSYDVMRVLGFQMISLYFMWFHLISYGFMLFRLVAYKFHIHTNHTDDRLSLLPLYKLAYRFGQTWPLPLPHISYTPARRHTHLCDVATHRSHRVGVGFRRARNFYRFTAICGGS